MRRPSSSLKSRNWESKRRGPKGCWILLAIIAGIVSSCALFLLYAASDAMAVNQSEIYAPPPPLTASKNSVRTILASLQLPNEPNFTSTVNDCTNVRKCKQHLPDTKNPDLQRVAFMSTGSNAAEKLFEIFKKALIIYHGNDESAMHRRIDFVFMTHVPALGYGKSHGWTKIIRVMHTPLVTETVEAMEASGANIEMNEKSSKDLVSRGMRQIIRYHCRLSQVAAHTSVTNIDLSSKMLVKEVMEAVKRIAADPGQHSIQNDFRKTDRLLNVETYLNDALSEPVSNTSFLLKNSMVDNDLSMLQAVLQDELDSTNNLRKWPCKSLWDVGDIQKDDVLSNTARKLVPDCNAPFTTCGVKKDRCEMIGDVKCK
jgi:hypothetical protein